ncbi:MAG: amidohydrolase family protein [Micrococcales bacterium]|nr:amidohydrolase family protein [Micrococcales bacterium]
MSRYVGEAVATGRIVIRNVTVVDPGDGSSLAGQDVTVRDGVIAAIASTGASSSGESVVDGTGKWLVPGYLDMHAHALNDPSDVDGAYALMLANGVTGFRQMSGSPALLAARRSGTLPAPVGAPRVLAIPGTILTAMNAGTPQAAATTVREQQRDGADFVKAGTVGGPGLRAALEEGARIGIPVLGHLPADMDPREAARLGMRSMEHLGPGASMFAAASSREDDVRPREAAPSAEPGPLAALLSTGDEHALEQIIRELTVNPAARTSPDDARALALADDTFDEEKAEALAEIFVRYETWQCPTLVRTHTQQFPHSSAHARDARRRYMAPDELERWDVSAARFAQLPAAVRDTLERHWQSQLRLTRILADAGVPMLAGTDADGASGVIPGFALHDEFAYLAEAGLSPVTILRMATSEAARFLHLDAELGSIAPGFRADAVLLDADPFSTHEALGAVAGVLRGGDWWDSRSLDDALRSVERAPGAR